MHNKLTISSTVQRNPDMLFNQLDGEVIMLSIENSEYYGMDAIGSRIWELMEKPIAVDVLVDSLIQEYDVEKAQCTTDVIEYLEELKKKNLIAVS
ncbi:MAG: lasso peptide biosynthesis PqqD family chaperone [Bacteroidota bacterium]